MPAVGWIPDVVPNAPILSSWGNDIRNRTVTVFASIADRDASIPAPRAGMVCWIVATKELQLYDGTQWTWVYAGSLRVIGENVRTTNTGAIGTVETVVSTAPITFTPVAGRQYYFGWRGRIGVSASLFPGIRLRVGTAAGAQLAMLTFVASNAAGVHQEGTALIQSPPLGAPISVVATAVGSSAGTVTVFGDAGQPMYWQILERIGTAPIL